MNPLLHHVGGTPVLVLPPDGPALRGEREAVDLIGDAIINQAAVVAVPVERCPDEFFQLATGVAGAVTQKFVNYRLRLAIIGDISAHVARSNALRDFVTESNRGNQLWFLATEQELAERLGRARA